MWHNNIIVPDIIIMRFFRSRPTLAVTKPLKPPAGEYARVSILAKLLQRHINFKTSSCRQEEEDRDRALVLPNQFVSRGLLATILCFINIHRNLHKH